MQPIIYTLATEFKKDIEINIAYDNIRVFTSNYLTKKSKYLIIKIEHDLEMKTKTHLLQLLILDVLTYLTNEPLCLIDFDKSQSINENLDKITKNVFLVQGKNKLADYNKLIKLWENSDIKQQKIMSNKIRMFRLNLLEKSDKKWK